MSATRGQNSKTASYGSKGARYRLGVIGVGMMGGALVRGALQARVLKSFEVIAFDADAERLQQVCDETGIAAASDNVEVVQSSKAILVAVKPQIAAEVLAPLRKLWTRTHLLISIMAGVSIDRIQQMTNAELAVARVMPNILCTVGAAASAVAFSSQVTQRQRQLVMRLLEAVGIVEEVEERLMDAVTGLSGSGPGFGAVVAEALADGGVAAGLPRDQAMRLAAQVLLGVGKYLLETGEHPGRLKDRVCSPAGTTITGIQALESRGLRAALIQAVVEAAKRSKELGKS